MKWQPQTPAYITELRGSWTTLWNNSHKQARQTTYSTSSEYLIERLWQQPDAVHAVLLVSVLPCMTPPARWSPAPASAPARCCSPRSTASPSSCVPSRSLRSGWRRNPSTTTAAPGEGERGHGDGEEEAERRWSTDTVWYLHLKTGTGGTARAKSLITSFNKRRWCSFALPKKVLKLPNNSSEEQSN